METRTIKTYFVPPSKWQMFLNVLRGLARMPVFGGTDVIEERIVEQKLLPAPKEENDANDH